MLSKYKARFTYTVKIYLFTINVYSCGIATSRFGYNQILVHVGEYYFTLCDHGMTLYLVYTNRLLTGTIFLLRCRGFWECSCMRNWTFKSRPYTLYRCLVTAMASLKVWAVEQCDKDTNVLLKCVIINIVLNSYMQYGGSAAAFGFPKGTGHKMHWVILMFHCVLVCSMKFCEFLCLIPYPRNNKINLIVKCYLVLAAIFGLGKCLGVCTQLVF